VDVPADNFLFPLISESLESGRVAECTIPLEIYAIYALSNRIEDQGNMLLAFPERFLSTFPYCYLLLQLLIGH